MRQLKPVPNQVGPKQMGPKKLLTVDDYINIEVEKKEMEVQKRREQRGKPLDDHIKDHFKAQVQSQVVKDKYEKAKGGTIDDFIKAYEDGRSVKR